MQRIRLLFISTAVCAVVALSGCAAQGVAAESRARTPAGDAQSIAASNPLAPSADKDNPGKGGKVPKDNQGNSSNQGAKGNNGNKNGKAKANNGQAGKPAKGDAGNARAAGPGNGRADVRETPAATGLGAWWRAFSGRFWTGTPEAKAGGWQLGRFKEAFPFAYPPGWTVRERGDAALVAGKWQDSEYVFQMTRTVQVRAGSLEEWVSGDLQRLGATGANVQYADTGRVQIAVVTGVNDPDYECPVAYVYLWTANPAGNNQRQARGVISQAPGSTCDPAALNAFVTAYLGRVGGEQATPGRTPSPSATARAATPTISPTQTPTRTPGASAAGWQRTRFFNAFSFAYPAGWSMDRLGDTAHLQGDYQGSSYVTDMVWVRDAPGAGLEQWVRADLADLGVNPEGIRIDYAPQGNDAQIAVVSGVRMQGYQCPVVRMYVLANNTAGAGERAYAVTIAQANDQPCNLAKLEDLAFQMVRQA